MSNKQTPGQRYNALVAKVRAEKRAKTSVSQRLRAIDRRISSLEAELLNVLREALGFVVDDVIQDEFGSMFRVTKISMPSLYLGDLNPSTFTNALSRVRIYGLLLNKNGIPTWSKERQIYGKVRKISVEAI